MSPAPIAVVAGGSGFLGGEIIRSLESRGYSIRRIGRSEAATWGDQDAVDAAVDGADLVVNLAGKSVNCRYTDAARDEILRSRVDTTRSLRHAVRAARTPPRVWFNASTATIYRHEMSAPHTEADGVLGEGFSVDVARAWEREFFEGELPRTRRVALRLAIVIGDGPATNTLLTLARTGLGGPQLDSWWFPHRRYRGIGPRPTGPERSGWHRTRGHQRFSWVHVDDVVTSLHFLAEREDIAGPVNIASPGTADNRELMRTLRRSVGAPLGLPAWRWMLEPAMWALRTEPELVLKSRWVMPATLTDAGYAFLHEDLGEAVRAVVDGAAR